MTVTDGAVSIDSISMRIPGLGADAGQRLAQLVAEGLADSLRLGPGEATLERVELELSAQPGETPQALAARIASELALLIGSTSALEAGR
jgi:hypothetical protein